MARQFIVSGLPFPVFVNETGAARQYTVSGVYFNETVEPPPVPAQAPLAWFDPDLIAGAWFDPELSLRGWFDREWAAVLVATTRVAADPGAYALTGTDALLTKRVNKTVAAGAGSYAVAGTAAALLRKWIISAGGGSYTLTGVDAALRNSTVVAGPRQFIVAGSPLPVFVNETGTRQYVVSGVYFNETGPAPKIAAAGSGSYALTGTAATLTRLANKTLAAGTASYAVTGSAAAVLHRWKPFAAAGSYSLAGIDAGIRHVWKVAATAGAYSLTGAAASLPHSWKLPATSSSYALTGADADLKRISGKFVSAQAGSYTLIGSSASHLRTHLIAADAGSYALTGTPATLLLISEPISIDIGGGRFRYPQFAKDGHADGAVIVVSVDLIAGRAIGSGRSSEQSIVIGLRCVGGIIAGNATVEGSMRLSGVSLQAGGANGEINISEDELLILAEAA